MVTVKASELIVSCLEEIPMLWHPFFPRTGLIGIVGASEAGKSLFARQLAISVVEGKNDFLGNRFNPVRKTALIVSTEDGQDSIGWLLKKQAADVSMQALDNLHFCFECNNLPRELDEQMSRLNPDVVVIDVWSDTFAGNPNNWSEVRRHLIQVGNLAEKYECLIVIIHHTVKHAEKTAPDKNKVNGSQSIEAKLRCIVELRNGLQSNQSELRVIKGNYLSREQKAEGMLLELNPDTFRFSNTGVKVGGSGFGDWGKSTYNISLWRERMAPLRKKGLPFEKTRTQLVEEFGEHVVPGLTTLKNIGKDLPVGQSNPSPSTD